MQSTQMFKSLYLYCVGF